MPASLHQLPPRSNAEIAARLNEIADLLDIQSANPFGVRAHRPAAAAAPLPALALPQLAADANS